MCDFRKNIYKCFKELNFNFDSFLSDQEYRIMFQKYGYLIKTYFGLSTGRFSLYIKGPYNPTLADVGFELANDKSYYDTTTESLKLKDKVCKGLKILKSVFNDDVDLLELYCTYRFLIDEENLHPNNEATIERLKNIKSFILKKYPNPNELITKVQHIHKQLETQMNTPVPA